jgi:hypothetical protein
MTPMSDATSSSHHHQDALSSLTLLIKKASAAATSTASTKGFHRRAIVEATDIVSSHQQSPRNGHCT